MTKAYRGNLQIDNIPKNYFVPDFGVDEDIIATQHSLKEAKYGKYKVFDWNKFLWRTLKMHNEIFEWGITLFDVF